MATINQDQAYEAVTSLPEAERLRVVERVIRDLADAARGAVLAGQPGEASSVVGLWADEADLVDQLVEGAMQGREGRRLRTNGDVDDG